MTKVEDTAGRVGQITAPARTNLLSLFFFGRSSGGGSHPWFSPPLVGFSAGLRAARDFKGGLDGSDGLPGSAAPTPFTNGDGRVGRYMAGDGHRGDGPGRPGLLP